MNSQPTNRATPNLPAVGRPKLTCGRQAQNPELGIRNLVWYALYTKPRWEKKVCKLLEAAGVTVFLPLIHTVRQWSDRKKKVQVPLINSYVFVKHEEKYLNSLLKHSGVVGILKHLKKPAIVRGYEIENLKIICQHPDVIIADEIVNVKKGTPVQITNGAMMGLYGECVAVKGKHRVLVGIKNLGLEFVLDIPLTYIEPLKK
ncbi:MAG: UpxY family transcription antiterminator [Flavobacteriaceae bacterium]|nr:UpxY family transcription antiterminator [Flavobacteriaceae bacterium]